MKRLVVDEERNLVILTFNSNFYPKELIENAVLDFKEICDLDFDGQKLILEPKNGGINIHLLGYEFYNYLLGLIKS
jgi:hypothetical protein